MLGDRDTSLFPSLRQGVPTGFDNDNDIPRSHTLRPRRETDPDISHELLICEGNWQGAESDPALLQDLIAEEASAGFLEEMPSLEAAFARWGRDRVAVGKVNIVKAPGRAARLVIDNSVCNTNQNCTVPEQFSLPSLQDIQAAFPGWPSEARSGALLLPGVGSVPPVVEAGAAAPPSVSFAVSGTTRGGGGALLLAGLAIDFAGGKVADGLFAG